MKILSRSAHTELTYLIAGVSYENIYAKLLQILSKEESDIFAKIEVKHQEAVWLTESDRPYKPYALSTEEEKDLIAEEIRLKRASVGEKIGRVAELAAFTDQILNVPSENQIFYDSADDGMKVILAQWGCVQYRAKRDFNTLGKLVDRPKTNHTLVEVLVQYSDKSLARNKPFFFFYRDVEKEFRTNEEARKSFGLLKNELQFSIATTPDHSKDEVQLTVIPGQTLYMAEFPLYTDAKVHVVNQLNEIVAKCSLKWACGSSTGAALSNDLGDFTLQELKLDGSPLRISLQENDQIFTEYQLQQQGNEFIFTIESTIHRNPVIRVVDKQGQPVAGYPVVVKKIGRAHV